MAETITAPHSISAARWRIVALVIGDAISFLVFAILGHNAHDVSTGWVAVAQIAVIALPFALAWFLVAPWVGVYRRAATSSPLRMLARTELGWLATYPAALILRVLLAPDHQMPIPFAIVILLANALLLGVWRLAFALVARWLARSR